MTRDDFFIGLLMLVGFGWLGLRQIDKRLREIGEAIYLLINKR